MVASYENKLLGLEPVFIEKSMSQKMIEAFAKSESPLTALLVRRHLKILRRHMTRKDLIAEGQVLFIQAGLNFNNLDVIDELQRTGYSVFVADSSRRAAVTTRVVGSLVWAKSLQEYFDQKLSILNDKLKKAEKGDNEKEINFLRAELASATLARLYLMDLELIPRTVSRTTR